MWRRLAIVAVLLVIADRRAEAFCGFYVNGAGGALFNNATQVVLVRQGTRTTLSMQNAYQGPPEAFAMVVPVPVVLQEQDVKTLPKEIFAKVDAMGAPRLVEYWEQDPCVPIITEKTKGMRRLGATAAPRGSGSGVTVEARFAVGEYQIVILSAKEAVGLERWLRAERYQIPAGAAGLLRPYVEGGAKFFVAKVDPAKVVFEAGRAVLSPLRFHYDSEDFALPIRLGLANSSGVQDLIVNILAEERYELANYPNVTIPTNLDVNDEVRTRFGEFYAALFDRTLAQHPGAVVTEYAWDAATCDPCPGPVLDGGDFATLGAASARRRGALVLTRLHARYGKDAVPEDLVFRAAPPIAGGRERYVSPGQLEERARPAPSNNFQGRYVIRHPWQGAIACATPQRGIWGGPPSDVGVELAAGQARAATDLARAPRGRVSLAALLARDLPELGVVAGAVATVEPAATPAPESTVEGADPLPPSPARSGRGCGCAAGGGEGPLGGLAGVALLAAMRRRRGGRGHARAKRS
ncbi:MAG: DUF2330 domain-containing protein [Kofleriaceae bacterium]